MNSLNFYNEEEKSMPSHQFQLYRKSFAGTEFLNGIHGEPVIPVIENEKKQAPKINNFIQFE